jgi:hypothetical protein
MPLAAATLGIVMACANAALAATNQFVRVEQDGNVYYGAVVGSASGSRFVDTCSHETIRLESDAEIAPSSRHCLDLSAFTGAAGGPPPPDASQTTARTAAVLIAEPIAVLHYDPAGRPLAPSSDVVASVGQARARGFGDIALALGQRLGVSVPWTESSADPASLEALCRTRGLVGVLVIAAPRLELFEPANGTRVANLYATLRGYRCGDRDIEDAGALAEGSRDQSAAPWTAGDAASAFASLATSLRRQLIALLG